MFDSRVILHEEIRCHKMNKVKKKQTEAGDLFNTILQTP